MHALADGHRDAFVYFRERCPYKVAADPGHEDGLGLGVCGLAVLGAGDVETLTAAIDLGHYDVEHRVRAQSWSARLQTALCQARCFAQSEPRASDELVANLPESSALGLAAWLGNVPCLLLLLKRGAEVGASNCYERTPLVLAAMAGHLAVCELLLEAKAALERDAWGRSAADWAQARGHQGLSRRLSAAAEPGSAPEGWEEAPAGPRSSWWSCDRRLCQRRCGGADPPCGDFSKDPESRGAAEALEDVSFHLTLPLPSSRASERGYREVVVEVGGL